MMWLPVWPTSWYDQFLQSVRKFPSAQVTGTLHVIESTSLWTRCSRIHCGFGPSKKYASTASLTIARNSSQVSSCVTMLSVKHSATYPPSASSVTSKTNVLSRKLFILIPHCLERNTLIVGRAIFPCKGTKSSHQRCDFSPAATCRLNSADFFFGIVSDCHLSPAKCRSR